ncbi:MAG: hypothetical protein ACQETB_08505 [Halobacteriota archaeon]
MDIERLERELADRFDCNDLELRVVRRQCRDLVDSGTAARDRGHELTVEEVCNHLADAPAGTDLVGRWNWWMGALDVAYGGYEQFTVRHVQDESDPST